MKYFTIKKSQKLEKIEKIENIRHEFYNEIEITRQNRVLEYIQNSKTVQRKDKVIFIAGGTYKSKDFISDLANTIDIEVLTVYSMRHALLWLIPFPLQNKFILKINDSQKIKDIFNFLDDYSLIELYIFDSNLEHSFLEECLPKKYFHDPLSVISKDSEYLLYGVDTDNAESSTNIMEFISYGSNTPQDITWFL